MAVVAQPPAHLLPHIDETWALSFLRVVGARPMATAHRATCGLCPVLASFLDPLEVLPRNQVARALREPFSCQLPHFDYPLCPRAA
eukprot:263408-Pyramimonas_sp.AAC.1